MSVKVYKCKKCGHEWASRLPSSLQPVLCPNPHCRSPRWQYPKGFNTMTGRMRGQITIVNLLVLLGVGICFMAFIPAITQFTTAYALPAVAASSMDQATKDLLSALINLFPVVLFVGILLTALAYAIPKREGLG